MIEEIKFINVWIDIFCEEFVIKKRKLFNDDIEIDNFFVEGNFL